MAGYADNRDYSQDVKYNSKYVRGALSGIDRRIELPESLRAERLLAGLEGIEPEGIRPPGKKKRRGQVYFPRFSLQSGLTYAAAFVLIVGLFYGLGMHTPETVLEGQIPIEEVSEFAEIIPETVQESAPQRFDLDVPESSGQSAPVTDEAAGAVSGEGAPLGVGGGGQSVLLLTEGNYDYSYRPNDVTDPDKMEFPITIEIFDNTADVLVAQIDVADMQSIAGCFIHGQSMTVTGQNDDGVITRVYSIENIEQPEEKLTVFQPGEYKNSRLYAEKGTVHTVTLCPGKTELDCAVEELPGSLSEEICVITAVDPTEPVAVQKAFSGATDDITLYNLNVYLSYEGLDEAGQLGVCVAQVRLEGTDIELGGVF